MLDMRDMGQSSKVSLFWSGQQAHDAAKKNKLMIQESLIDSSGLAY
jgi:hypothetical protein